MPLSFTQTRRVGIISILLCFIFLTVVSCVSDPTFRSYYTKITDVFGVSDTWFVAYILESSKLVHFFCYGLLAGLTYFTFKKSYPIAFLLPLSVGVTLEVLQRFSPTRTPRVLDIIINGCGITLMLVGLYLWQRICRPQQANISEQPRQLHLDFLKIYQYTLPWNKQGRRPYLLDMDWQQLVELALRHKVFTSFWPALKKIAPSISQNISQYGEQIFRENTFHCLLLTGELLKVSQLIEQNNINIVPFKGPELATRLYGGINHRTYADLDILVPSNEAYQAFYLLIGQNYEPEINLSARQFKSYLHHEDNISLTHPETNVQIELHWELSGKYLVTPFDYSFIAKRLLTRTLEGRKIKVLSDEDLLIYFCLHGTKHGWNQLELVDCIGRLLAQRPQLNWPLIENLCTQLQCRRMILIGLGLAHRSTGIPLPPHIMTELNEDRKTQRLLRLAEENLAAMSTAPSPPKDLRVSTLRLTSRDNLGNQLRYLGRMIFIPSKAQWKKYSFPESLSFLHYVVRPFMILWAGVAGSLSGKWIKM